MWKRSWGGSWRSSRAKSARSSITSFPNPTMRHSYSYDAPRGSQIDVGETHVTLREPSGRVLTARILEKVTDAKGQITSLLLDRIVHERHGRIEGWEASGCYVTELTADVEDSA